MKAVVAAFNQEKALVGAFSVITNLRMELFEALVSTVHHCYHLRFFMTAMLLPTGMTAASFTIMWMRIKLEKHSLVFCSSGAFAGTIFGKTQ